MKKTVVAFFLLVLCLSVFAQNGVIRELSGTVEIKAPGDSEYIPANSGDQISQNTIISTGFRSTALVEVGSARINVRPLTRLSLAEISAASGTETVNVNLQAGRVRVDVNPPAGSRASMSVTSPSATASVRGTSFDFDGRNIRVHHGKVGFKGTKGPQMLVNAGSNSKVEQSGKAADPVEEKKNKLRPPKPVGTDSSSGTTGDTAPSSGMLAIEITYN
ncbi:MAG: FecR family protein [Treponema sp.]|nr:FecR family protein [Treponema sp.]